MQMHKDAHLRLERDVNKVLVEELCYKLNSTIRKGECCVRSLLLSLWLYVMLGYSDIPIDYTDIHNVPIIKEKLSLVIFKIEKWKGRLFTRIKTIIYTVICCLIKDELEEFFLYPLLTGSYFQSTVLLELLFCCKNYNIKYSNFWTFTFVNRKHDLNWSLFRKQISNHKIVFVISIRGIHL